MLSWGRGGSTCQMGGGKKRDNHMWEKKILRQSPNPAAQLTEDSWDLSSRQQSFAEGGGPGAWAEKASRLWGQGSKRGG